MVPAVPRGPARGAPELVGAGRLAPDELSANVSDWWLMLEALWDPISLALKWSVGIAMSIKGLATGILWCLERGKAVPKRRREDAADGAHTTAADAKKEE